MTQDDRGGVTDLMRQLGAAPEEPLEVYLGRLEAGALIGGRYTLERRLGKGGFGEVWAARGPDGALVALKVLLPSKSHDTLQRAAFEQELRSLARVSHPGVVKLLDEGVHGESRFGALELLEGGPLRLDGMDLAEVLRVFDLLLATLGHVHARGLIHRDLKPANIFVVARSGQTVPSLLDFGIAHIDEHLASKLRIRRVELGKAGVPMGSLSYMSPEQASGAHDAVGPATDLYAVGILMFECLTGRLPFEGGLYQIVFAHIQQPPPPMGLPEALAPLEALVMGLLAKGYSQRPECAADVRRSLAKIAAALPVGQWSVPFAPRREGTEAHADTDTALFLGDEVLSAPVVVSVAQDLGDRRSLPVETDGTLRGWRTASIERDVPWRVRKLREMPLIGREALCAQLEALAREVVADRRSRGVVLTGPGGSGRGIVGRWLAQQVREEGLMRLLQVDLGARPELDDAVRVAMLGHLRWPRQEPEAIVARLAEVFGPNPNGWRHETDWLLGGRQDGEGREAMWTRLVQRAAAHPFDRPVLIWIVGAGRRAQADVARWVDALIATPGTRALVVWSVNTVTEHFEAHGHLQALTGLDRVSVLSLEPLPEAPQRRLIEALEPALSPDAVELLASRCQGNPHFIRETLFGWHEAGLLSPSDKGLSPAADAWGAFSLQDVERHRLDALLMSSDTPEALRRALGLMALLDRGFSRQQARWCLEDSDHTAESLLQQRILSQRAVARKAHLSFSDQTLKSLLLEAPDTESLSPTAIEYRLRESLAAMGAGDWEATRQELREANALLSHCADAERTTLEPRLIDARARLAYRQKNPQALQEAIDALSRVGRGVAAAFWLGVSHRIGQDHKAAREALEAVCLRGADDPDTAAMAWFHLGETLLGAGTHKRASAALTKSIEMLEARAAAAPSAYLRRLFLLMSADARRALAEGHGLRARKGDAAAQTSQEQCLFEALEIYQDFDDLQGQARLYVVMTRMWRQSLEWAQAQGDGLDPKQLDKAQAAWDRLDALTGVIGDDKRGLALKDWEAAGLAGVRRDFRLAEVFFLRARVHFQAIGADFEASLAINGLGEMARLDGRWSDALGYLRQFRARMREQQLDHNEAIALLNMAWVGLQMDMVSDVRLWLMEASELLQMRGFDAADKDDLAAVRTGLAECAARENDWVQTVKMLREALTFTKGGPVLDDRARASLLRTAERMRASTNLLASQGLPLAEALAALDDRES